MGKTDNIVGEPQKVKFTLKELKEAKKEKENFLENIIEPVKELYLSLYAEMVCLDNAKELIWREYVKFNTHCKTNYMLDSQGRLDRHKVCACYMYAIIKANTLSCRLAKSNTEESYLCLNEQLAITVGMSLLRAFICADIKYSTIFSEEEKQSLYAIVENGIIFPECNHGDYRDNFAAELHYTNEERNYNILSLANTLYLLEIHTLKIDVIYKKVSRNEE